MGSWGKTSERLERDPTRGRGGYRLLDLLGLAFIAGAVLLAWKVDVAHRERRSAVADALQERCELLLADKSSDLSDYVHAVRTSLDLLAVNGKVRRFDASVRGDVARAYGDLHERYGLGALHVTPAPDRGLPEPFLRFAAGAGGDVVLDAAVAPDEIHMEKDHLDAYRNDATLTSLISPRVTIGAGEPGLLISCPVRDGGRLVGLVAATIPERRIGELLERGSGDVLVLLINHRSEVYASDAMPAESMEWVSALVSRHGLQTVIDRPCPVHGDDEMRSVATEVDIPDSGPWWLVQQFDPDAVLALGSEAEPFGGRGLAGLVLFTGLGLAVSLWVVRNWLQERIESLQARRAEERILRRVAEGTMGDTGEAFFRGLAKCLADTLGYSFAFVGRTDPCDPGHGDTLAFWNRGEFGPAIRYRLAGSPSAEVMKLGRYFCPEHAADLFPDDGLLAELGIESYLGVTLYDTDGEAAGIMAVMSRRPMSMPSARVQSYLQIFAVRASAELTRLRSEERIRALNADLENRVAKRTSELKSAQEKLVEFETMKALASLVSGVAHEINTPVGIGVTAVTHLRDRLDVCQERYAENRLSRSRLEEFLGAVRETTDLIYSNLKRAAELVTDFKQVAVERNAEEPRSIHMASFLNERTRDQRALLEQAGIGLSLAVADGLRVTTCPEALARVVHQLIANSEAHGFPRARTGEISVRVTCNGASWRLVYEDDGVGMAPETVRRVFEPFYTTRRGVSGSGLGMHIVYNTVTRTLGGTIRCDSVPGHGTRIDIVCPREVPAEVIPALSS